LSARLAVDGQEQIAHPVEPVRQLREIVGQGLLDRGRCGGKFLQHPAHEARRDAQHRGGFARRCGGGSGETGEQGGLADERTGPGNEGGRGSVLRGIEGHGAPGHDIAAVRAVALAEQHVPGPQRAMVGREGQKPQGIPVEKMEQGRLSQHLDIVVERHVPAALPPGVPLASAPRDPYPMQAATKRPSGHA
jgi:hypothetical protein